MSEDNSTRGSRFCKQSRSFSSVFRFMYGHSLQLQFSLATKWNFLSVASLCNECCTPLSVITMNSFASELTQKSMIAEVEPMKSAMISTS